MKYIKTYEKLFDFLKRKETPIKEETPEEKHRSNVRQYLKNNDFTINKDFSVDVFGDVNLNKLNPNLSGLLNELPIKFNKIEGNFSVTNSKLKSLRLCPVSVSGDFDCSGNWLKDLKGSPESVGGDFSVRSLGHLYSSEFCLKTLEGCPKSIGGDFDFSGNGIYTFEYFPDFLGGDIICKSNPIDYIWKMFQDKTKIEIFNAFDPIKPPEEDNGKPILYLDILENFLDELDKITNKGIIEDLDYNSMEYSNKIMIWYDVRLSKNDATIRKNTLLVRLFMKLIGTLPERRFDDTLGKWLILDKKTGEWKVSNIQNLDT